VIGKDDAVDSFETAKAMINIFEVKD